MTEEQQSQMRLQYAGAIGLLAEIMPHVPDGETRDQIEQACLDWAAMTKWGVRRILNRMDLTPPRPSTSTEETK